MIGPCVMCTRLRTVHMYTLCVCKCECVCVSMRVCRLWLCVSFMSAFRVKLFYVFFEWGEGILKRFYSRFSSSQQTRVHEVRLPRYQ